MSRYFGQFLGSQARAGFGCLWPGLHLQAAWLFTYYLGAVLACCGLWSLARVRLWLIRRGPYSVPQLQAASLPGGCLKPAAGFRYPSKPLPGSQAGGVWRAVRHSNKCFEQVFRTNFRTLFRSVCQNISNRILEFFNRILKLSNRILTEYLLCVFNRI